MPKVNVIIETSEDGHPLWDEARLKQIHATVRAGHKPNHHEGRENSAIDNPHYSGRQYRANSLDTIGAASVANTTEEQLSA